MTRAKQQLYLLRAFRRRSFGTTAPNVASRFLSDIPSHLLDVFGYQNHTPLLGAANYDRWYSAGGGGEKMDSQPEAPFRAGDKVEHANFGRGIIISCLAISGDYEVTVAFTGGSGVKRLLDSFARLLKVG